MLYSTFKAISEQQILFWLFKISGVKQAFTINKHRKATRHLLKKGAIHYRQLTTILKIR